MILNKYMELITVKTKIIDFKKINAVFDFNSNTTRKNLSRIEEWFLDLLVLNKSRCIDYVPIERIIDLTEHTNLIIVVLQSAFFHDISIIQLRINPRSICADICDYQNHMADDCVDNKLIVENCSMYTACNHLVHRL